MDWHKKLGVMAGVLLATLFVACGDDDSSSVEENKTSSGPASVESLEDLVHCTKSHYGEIVFVEEEDAYFECTSADWVEVDSAKVDSILTASSSSEGASEEAKSSSSVKADSSEVAKVETKKVDSVAVSGYAQKGPFTSGTAVTVFGLDSALEVTKTKFTGKVSGDSGAFKVEKIVLPSQFALVQVSGFYANEVTGKNTSGTKTTLNAIVDLSAGKSVKANVNLFTELEYARVKHLVLKEKFNVPAAKKRATKELLAIFGAKAGDDLMATDLTLSDTTSAGVAMLAASILLQGDLSVSKFGLRLGEIGDLFASTGSLDSDTLRADLADWASKVDSTNNFATIRTNVKNMKLVTTVPDFEKILYTFWTAEYSLAACTDSLESTLVKNDNKLSDNYGAGYVCTSKHWHKATALDSDLGLCTAKMEGSYKEYKGGKSTEYYVCKSGTWNKITETQFELKECSEKREKEYVKAKSGEYFVCIDKQWIELDAVTYELKLCTETRNMEIAKTEKSGSYVCEWDGKNGNWRKASDAEVELGICGTESALAGRVYKTKGGDYYLCASGEWKKSNQLSYEIQGAGECTAEKNLTTFETESLGLYVCDNKEWRKATALETQLGVCGDKDNSDSTFKLDGAHYYVCLNTKWTETDAKSFEVKKLCGEANSDKRVKSNEDNYYICQNSGGKWTWNSIDIVIYELGFCQKSENDSTMGKTSDNHYWHCANNQWESISDTVFSTKKFCNAKNDSTIVNGYACVHTGTGNSAVYIWRTATAGEIATNAFCNNEYMYKVKNGFVCNNDLVWRKASAAEIATGMQCYYGIVNQLSNSYVCADGARYEWRAATEGEIATGQVCNKPSKTYMLEGYVCAAQATSWRKATDIEIAAGGVCGDFIKDSTRLYAEKYVCSKSGPCLNDKLNDYCWRNATTLEKQLQQVCWKAYEVSYNGYHYSCDVINNARDWRKFTSSEETYGVCRTADDGKYIEQDGDIYKCYGSTHTWSQVTVSSFTNTSDKYTYRYMHIGDYDYMIDNVKNHHDNDSASNWWCYENKWKNCNQYGMLYTWTAVLGIPQSYLTANYTGSLTGIQGACPDGWHVPTKAEMTAIGNSTNTSLRNIINKDVGSYEPTQSPGWQISACYWMAEEYANIADVAWDYVISFNSFNQYKRNGCYLRCVR